MGSLCCCISREDLEEYASYPSGRIYQHCFCLRCCIRHILSMRDGLTRREKTYLYEESESGCRESDACGETLTILQKRTGIEGEQTKGYCTETSEKHLSAKSLLSVESVVALVEDEDVCPTCLDEYTTENPKISTQCGHHFHLGCIYEWMERSDNCPVCGKEMVFSESP
eukprot:TRINITY_DN3355_c0_g1_i1.p1 TRINITY_DN3355_c0_g1~~TRINITY_DN3355_c0_g1_i1.p1  ORF type:complete len:169 (-),score=29.89 TRINITY_DN3355_c0_g1_i1:199-705(-)